MSCSLPSVVKSSAMEWLSEKAPDLLRLLLPEREPEEKSELLMPLPESVQ